jgi:hypothetical protein
MKNWIIAGSFGLLIACGATKILEPGEKDAVKAKTKFPEATLADLQAGKNIYQQHCGGCHPHKKIKKFTEAQWRNITPKMVVKANKKYNTVVDAAGEKLLLQYLVTMADA